MASKTQNWRGEADTLALDGLEERIDYLTQLRDQKLEEQRKEAVNRIKEIMAENRLSIDDVADKPQPRKASATGRKMAPKYRDPSNRDNIWSGQGRAPRWMPENKEQWVDFLIRPE